MNFVIPCAIAFRRLRAATGALATLPSLLAALPAVRSGKDTGAASVSSSRVRPP